MYYNCGVGDSNWQEWNIMENTDLREVLKQYSDKWIALSSDSSRVVGVADIPADALKQAYSHNEPNPILTKVPEHYGTYIL
jgi:hypothetical protein